MSKQNLVISIVIIVSLVLGGLSGLYFYLRQQDEIKGGKAATINKGSLGFGSGISETPEPSTPSEIATTTPVVTATIPRPIPELRHLTQAPIAGASFITKDVFATTTVLVGTSTRVTSRIIGSVEVIRWVDRATGKIYETASTTLETTKISNMTTPKIYEAYFLDPKGNSFIFRDLLGESDTIQTRYGVLQAESPTSSEQTLKFTNLPTNITQLAVSPTKDQIFSILPTNTRGIISKTDGTSQTNVFNSPFHEWLAAWPSPTAIVLNTKPSGTIEGYAYILNPRTRALTKLVGNRNGLTTLLSPDTNNVLIGESPLGTIQLSVLDRRNNTIRSLFIRTFPEKCVWSKKEIESVYCAIPEDLSYAIYPDVWYQGLVSFSDSLWKINTNTTESRRLVQPSAVAGVALDMTNLSLSANEDFIIFQDKNDLSLWSYQITKPFVPATATTTTQ